MNKVKNDWHEHKKSVINDLEEEFDMWLDFYFDDVDTKFKDEIIVDFGISNLIVELPKIAEVHCFYTYDDFVKDANYDKELINNMILMYIVRKYIITTL